MSAGRAAWRAFVIGALLAGASSPFALAACSATSRSDATPTPGANAKDAAYDGPPPACTAYTKSTSPCTTASSPRPPYVTASDPQVICAECNPRCGAVKLQGTTGGPPWYLETDLPSGPCPTEGETCGMGAFDEFTTCGGMTYACNVTAYGCACRNGSWACFVTAEGAGGGCGGLCDLSDASSDAAGDAPSD